MKRLYFPKGYVEYKTKAELERDYLRLRKGLLTIPQLREIRKEEGRLKSLILSETKVKEVAKW